MLAAVVKGGGASPAALKLGEDDITRNILAMLSPIFKRHVQLAKQSAAIAFNEVIMKILMLYLIDFSLIDKFYFIFRRHYKDAIIMTQPDRIDWMLLFHTNIADVCRVIVDKVISSLP